MSGIADLVQELHGAIRITDWKTGAVLDEEGSVKREYKLQLAAYYLLAAERWPERPIEVYLFNGSELRVELDSVDFEDVRRSVTQLRSGAGDSKNIAAASLTSVGSECASCQLRMRCPAFMTALHSNGRFLTAEALTPGRDVIGHVLSCKTQGDGLIANLRLPDGSLCQLRGLTQRLDLTSLIGRQVVCFGLTPLFRKSSATGEIQPPNTFFEIGPMGRAWQAEIFEVGPGRPSPP